MLIGLELSLETRESRVPTLSPLAIDIQGESNMHQIVVTIFASLPFCVAFVRPLRGGIDHFPVLKNPYFLLLARIHCFPPQAIRGKGDLTLAHI